MRYIVWTVGTRPENGTPIEAKSSFEARKLCADAWRRPIEEVMANREELLKR